MRAQVRGLLCLAVVALLAGSAAAQPTVMATVDRTRVRVGEATVLSIEVRGAQNTGAPDVSLGSWRVQYVGPSTQMRIENGVTSSSVTHRYQMFPQKPGRYRLGPYRLKVGGQGLQTEPIVVEVAPRGSQPVAQGQPQLILQASLGDAEPFVGERVPLTVRLLIPAGMRVDDLEFPVASGEKLSVGAMPQPAQRDERMGGRAFRVLYFETHVSPLARVDTELVVTMKLSVLERRQGGGRRRGIFDMFDSFSQRRPVELRSEPVRVNVRPLPAEGRPDDFAGAVGKYDLRVSASPTSVNAGDPVTVRVVVRGQGDLTKVRAPRIDATDGLRVYDPLPIADLGDAAKGVEQVVIPQSSDVSELPALSFSFFDPEAERYRTLRRGPLRLQVAAATGGAASVVAQGESGRAEKAQGPVGRDIVFIKRAPGEWTELRRSWWSSWWMWLLHGLPVLALAGVWWRSRQAGLLAANPKLRRFREAEAAARASLGALDASRADLVDVLSAAIAEYLGAKLDLPPGAIEADRLASALADVGCAPEVCEQVRSFFADLEALRYAPGAGDESVRRGLLARAESIVGGLAERSDLESRLHGAIVLLAVSLVSASAMRADVASETGPDAAFFEGNAAYAEGKYEDALADYQQVVDLGVESAALHFNIGNTHFKLGQPAQAVASYLRAARLRPGDPDVEANLSFAEESLELGSELDPLWWRIPFAPAYALSSANLALVFSLLWWGSLALVAAAMTLPRQRSALRWPLRIVAVLALLAFANFAYRGRNLELWHDAVVTAEHDVTVRFEPAGDATEHFVAPVGSRLVVDEVREDWSLVERRDGRRGWAENAAITRLR